jgi:hypothetical protein
VRHTTDAFVAILRGVFLSLVVYWLGVWIIDATQGPAHLLPCAKYVGWTACVTGTMLTAYSLGEPSDRIVLFGLGSLASAIPLTFLAHSDVILLGNLTYSARVAAAEGRRPIDPILFNEHMAFHVLPALIGLVTVLSLAGTIVFRQKPDRY